MPFKQRPINVTTPEQTAAIRAIKPVIAKPWGYDHEFIQPRPCAVTLRDGTIIERAFLNENPRYSDLGDWINPEMVADIRESPHRLPPGLVKQLYECGESGMGYLIYKLHFKNAPPLVCVAGNFHFDFPWLRNGYDPADAIAVTPHEGRQQTTTGDYCRSAPAPVIDFVFHDDPNLPK